MNFESITFPLLHLSLSFMLLFLLDYSPASSASLSGEWYLNCNNSLNCDNATALEFPLWRNNGTDICGYPEAMKLRCNGSRATMEILGAQYELLGFSTNDQFLLIGEIDFWDGLCSTNISSYIYGIIPMYYHCKYPQIPEKPTCFEVHLSYMPFESWTAIADAYCMLSAAVAISPMLLNKLGGLQEVAQRIIAELESKLEVDAQACRSCSVSGGICGYEDSIDFNPLFFSQPKCFCQSSSNGFEICPSSAVAAPEPSSRSGTYSNFVLACFWFHPR